MGLFTVPHKVTSDRLIVDRRAQNETEKRLGWAKFPHGTTLCQIRLSPKDHLRASSLDLSSYFYNLKNPAEWQRRTAFGRVFTGKKRRLNSGVIPAADTTYVYVSGVWEI